MRRVTLHAQSTVNEDFIVGSEWYILKAPSSSRPTELTNQSTIIGVVTRQPCVFEEVSSALGNVCNRRQTMK